VQLVRPLSLLVFYHANWHLDTLFYDIYTQLSELHLRDAGIDVEWSDVDVEGGMTEDRWGSTRSYFKARFYRLPVGKMIQHNV